MPSFRLDVTNKNLCRTHCLSFSFLYFSIIIMGKVTRTKGARSKARGTDNSDSLETQIMHSDSVRPPGRTKKRARKDDEEGVNCILSLKFSETESSAV